MKYLLLLVVFLAHQVQGEKILYYQYMTPEWIMNNAAFVHPSGYFSSKQLRFTSKVSSSYTRLVQVNMISPSILDINEDIAVKIVVSMDQKIGTTQDSDISFMISDTVNSLGGFTIDKMNMATGSTPCSGVQGKSGSVLTQVSLPSFSSGGSKTLSYPAEYTFRLKLQQRWGSCFASVEGGFTNTFKFMPKLKQSNGLDLEIYKSGVAEQLGIKFMVVTITKEN